MKLTKKEKNARSWERLQDKIADMLEKHRRMDILNRRQSVVVLFLRTEKDKLKRQQLTAELQHINQARDKLAADIRKEYKVE